MSAKAAQQRQRTVRWSMANRKERKDSRARERRNQSATVGWRERWVAREETRDVKQEGKLAVRRAFVSRVLVGVAAASHDRSFDMSEGRARNLP